MTLTSQSATCVRLQVSLSLFSSTSFSLSNRTAEEIKYKISIRRWGPLNIVEGRCEINEVLEAVCNALLFSFPEHVYIYARLRPLFPSYEVSRKENRDEKEKRQVTKRYRQNQSSRLFFHFHKLWYCPLCQCPRMHYPPATLSSPVPGASVRA